MPGVHVTKRPFEAAPDEIAGIVRTLRPDWLAGARWLQRKGAPVRGVSLRDHALLPGRDAGMFFLAALEIRFGQPDDADYGRGEHVDLYSVPLAIYPSFASAREAPGAPDEPLVVVRGPGYEAAVCDATASAAFAGAVFRALGARSRVRGRRGTFEFDTVGRPCLPHEVKTAVRLPETSTNTLVTVESTHILKFYRRMIAGASPDLEMSVRLTEAGFGHLPRVAGYAVYRADDGQAFPILLAQEYVHNRGDALQMAIEDARQWARNAQARGEARLALADAMAGRYARLGVVTAELHLGSARVDDEAFRPEPMRPRDVLELGESLSRYAAAVSDELERATPRRREGGPLVPGELIERTCRALSASRDLGARIRTHGDLHLGQLLQVGDESCPDFIVTDFEGEPLRPVEERRRKHSPLRDVAGMLRSFDYAAWLAVPDDRGPRDDAPGWARRAADAFLSGYLDDGGARNSGLLPADAGDVRMMLACFGLEKALYEVRYELGNRPDLVAIPLAGVAACVDELRTLLGGDCASGRRRGES